MLRHLLNDSTDQWTDQQARMTDELTNRLADRLTDGLFCFVPAVVSSSTKSHTVSLEPKHFLVQVPTLCMDRCEWRVLEARASCQRQHSHCQHQTIGDCWCRWGVTDGWCRWGVRMVVISWWGKAKAFDGLVCSQIGLILTDLCRSTIALLSSASK